MRPARSRERQRAADQSRKAATGPGADKYTSATVAPLTAVNVNALGLSVPGTLTVGTLSDAPPSICINSAGQLTGFDNELLRAIADKLGLNINFVGTEFSGLLAQVASRRFDVGSSSITTTDARWSSRTRWGSPGRRRTRWCSWITVRWSNRVRRSKYSREPRRTGCADFYHKFCEAN